jgi:hypothetical protein
VLVGTIANVDNDNLALHRLDEVRLGATGGVDSTTSGSTYFDNLESRRYTYNIAGYLTQVETHNGSGWDVQAEMAYNGLGQCLSMDAAGVIAYYVMDGNRPLTAESNSNTTSYLYGLGVIGKETNECDPL